MWGFISSYFCLNLCTVSKFRVLLRHRAHTHTYTYTYTDTDTVTAISGVLNYWVMALGSFFYGYQRARRTVLHITPPQPRAEFALQPL